MMETLMQLLELLGPVVVALLTVPLMSGIKSVVTLIDQSPSWLQRLLVVIIAFALAKISTLVGVALPESLADITLDNLEALGAAGLAFAFHAGDRASADNEP